MKPTLLGGAALAAMVFWSPISPGGTVSTNANLPKDGAPVGGGATFELKAFGLQLAPIPAGPNPMPSPGSGPRGLIVVFVRPFLLFYGPSVGLSGATGPGISGLVVSASPNSTGVVGIADWSDPASKMTADAAVPSGFFGSAAAHAADPYVLPASVYEHYSYTVNDPTLQLDPAQPEVVAASFFATDSRFQAPLWSLGVSATGVLNSNSDLDVTFTSNPILGLDDALIASQARDAFTVSSGTAELKSFTLFDTTSNVSQDITYSEGTNGAVESLPELSALVQSLVLGLGVAALAWWWTARKIT
jgi:hypothetical protein